MVLMQQQFRYHAFRWSGMSNLQLFGWTGFVFDGENCLAGDDGGNGAAEGISTLLYPVSLLPGCSHR